MFRRDLQGFLFKVLLQTALELGEGGEHNLHYVLWTSDICHLLTLPTLLGQKPLLSCYFQLLQLLKTNWPWISPTELVCLYWQLLPEAKSGCLLIFKPSYFQILSAAYTLPLSFLKSALFCKCTCVVENCFANALLYIYGQYPPLHRHCPLHKCRFVCNFKMLMITFIAIHSVLLQWCYAAAWGKVCGLVTNHPLYPETA